MKNALWLLVLLGCGLSEERYWEIRAEEECRIFGPDCVGDYTSVEACLGDGPMGQVERGGLTFHPEEARECLESLRTVCPVLAMDYDVPDTCEDVYRVAEE